MSHLKKAIEFYAFPQDEIELIKATYRKDPEAAAEHFAALAKHIDLMKRTSGDRDSRQNAA